MIWFTITDESKNFSQDEYVQRYERGRAEGDGSQRLIKMRQLVKNSSEIAYMISVDADISPKGISDTCNVNSSDLIQITHRQRLLDIFPVIKQYI